jgi:hypothetical protein
MLPLEALVVLGVLQSHSKIKFMKYIEYLYYKFIKFQERVGNADIAPFTAMIFLIFISILYLFFFITLFSLLFPNIKIVIKPISCAIILPITLFIIYYYLLVYGNKYKEIIKKYETKDTTNIFAWLFVIVGFILINLGWILKMLQNQGKLF